MTKRLAGISPLTMEGVEIAVVDGIVRFTGTLSMRDPSSTVTPFLRRIHAATIESGLRRLTVDLSKLKFMNSSSIRSLVDWVEWIRKEPDARQYVLHFVTKPNVTWQETTLSAIQSLGGEHVVVQSGL